MRILHLADIHIGVENYGRPATEADLEAMPEYFAPGVDRKRTYLGLSTRLLDFLVALDEVVEYATQNDVDLVLFAGDAYKSRDPSQTHQREFARRIATLVNRDIPVFLLTGNHDIAHSLGRATALEIFPTLGVKQVHVAERMETFTVETRSGPLQIVALPWIRRGALLQRDEHRGATIEELARYIESDLTERILAEAQTLDPTIPAILAAHVTVAGAVTSSERSMMLGRDYSLQRSSVGLPSFDYVALGHIHKHQQLGDHPPVVYPGSLQRVDFSEEGDDKGFCLVEIDSTAPVGERTKWSHIPIKARTFLTIDVKVPDDEEDPTALVVHEVNRKYVTDAVVRVHITISSTLASRINEKLIREALSEAHSIAAVSKEVIHDRMPRLGSAAQSMSPQQALEWYLDSRGDLDEKAIRQALTWGTDLVTEEMARE